jgi:hypothetical protein
MLMSMGVLAGMLAVGDGGAPGLATAPPAAARPPSVVPAPPSSPSGAPVNDYRLERAKDASGDLLYEAPAFRARITRDGSVRFSNKHISVLNLIPFLPGPPPAGVPTLESTIRSLGRKGPKAPAPTADPLLNDQRLPADSVTHYRPDPREACQYPRSCFFEASVVLVGVSARLDISDEIMRLHGQDPYRYEKARFLTATREMRARMATKAHAEDLQLSAAEVPARLQQIACDSSLTLSEKKALLEALRAELDSGPDAQRSADLIRATLQSLAQPDGGVVCPGWTRPSLPGGAKPGR